MATIENPVLRTFIGPGPVDQRPISSAELKSESTALVSSASFREREDKGPVPVPVVHSRSCCQMLQKPPLLRRIDETSSQFHPGSPDKPLADEPTGFLLFGWQRMSYGKHVPPRGCLCV